MTYKFDAKNNEKVIIPILSVMTIGAMFCLFIFNSLIIDIIVFLVSAFDFYCSRRIYRRNKTRIKELLFVDNAIRFSFFSKNKDALVVKETDCDITINEGQAIITGKDTGNILGIANKKDLEEPKQWEALLSELMSNRND
ncbi:hypothetical protein [Mucilaginibacter sp. dw_454]|uniref:hypothetical protein n=1 Tax=Mucilaginibacter sp. dw_454 TaxID=2720079 RepID=UPI001BD200FE|nr:hypothetical protein [Mucilaginibacter sp. dw_454]